MLKAANDRVPKNPCDSKIETSPQLNTSVSISRPPAVFLLILQTFFEAEITKSSDLLPAPPTNRKRQVDIWAKSERISCNTAQIPDFGGAGGAGNGLVPKYKLIFVLKMATIICIIK